MGLTRTVWRTFVLALFALGCISVLRSWITKNIWINGDEYKQIVHGHQKATLINTQSYLVATNRSRRNNNVTKLDDVFISIKTSAKFHKTRLEILMNTWIPEAINQVYVFTDTDDTTLQKRFPSNHVINTNCSTGHTILGLNCKMAWEFDVYFIKNNRWFCHFDDDNYVNLPNLVALLQNYNHSDDWYLGKPSLNHQMRGRDRAYPGQSRAFWFAHGGAGFCISQRLVHKMKPHVTDGGLMNLSSRIGLNDDCTVGYLINNLLQTNLTVIQTLYSHRDQHFTNHTRLYDIKEAITLSYPVHGGRIGFVKIPGFSIEHDPTRFYSIHCFLKQHTPCINNTAFWYKQKTT